MSLVGIKNLFGEEKTNLSSENEKNFKNIQLKEIRQPDSVILGGYIREIRLQNGYSQKNVAEAVGMTSSHLSMVERGMTFLSPARLAALARFFNLSLTDLIGGTKRKDPLVIRKGLGRHVGLYGSGITIEQLSVSQNLMDAEIWTVKPGKKSDGFYNHDGEELIYLLEGEFEITIANKGKQCLYKGDSIYFNSHSSHSWGNPGNKSAKILWINTDKKRGTNLYNGKLSKSLPVRQV